MEEGASRFDNGDFIFRILFAIAKLRSEGSRDELGFMGKRFLTARETSQYLGLSEATIRRWALRGQIPFSKFGKALRFDLRRIEKWVKNQEGAYSKRVFK